MSKVIEETGDDDGSEHLLPTPDVFDSSTAKIRIYCFNSPAFLDVKVYRKHTNSELLNHILTLYKRDPQLSSSKPLKYPDTTEAYELRHIDDDEEEYTPFMDVAPLEGNEQIGSFDCLALVEKKGYRPSDLSP